MSPGWIGFLVGLFVGGNLAVIAIGLFIGRKCDRCKITFVEALERCESSRSLSSAPPY